MVFTKRERILIAVTLAAVCLLVLDIYALKPMRTRREAVRTEKAQLAARLAQARTLLKRRRLLGDRWRRMLAEGMKRGPAEAEGQLLRSLRNWSAEAGLRLSSLRPERSQEELVLGEITVHAAGTGSMRSASRLLWRIETAKIPVKIKMLQLGSRKDGTDDLSLHLKVSTLYLPAEPAPGDQVASRDSTKRGGP